MQSVHSLWGRHLKIKNVLESAGKDIKAFLKGGNGNLVTFHTGSNHSLHWFASPFWIPNHLHRIMTMFQIPGEMPFFNKLAPNPKSWNLSFQPGTSLTHFTSCFNIYSISLKICIVKVYIHTNRLNAIWLIFGMPKGKRIGISSNVPRIYWFRKTNLHCLSKY